MLGSYLVLHMARNPQTELTEPEADWTDWTVWTIVMFDFPYVDDWTDWTLTELTEGSFNFRQTELWLNCTATEADWTVLTEPPRRPTRRGRRWTHTLPELTELNWLKTVLTELGDWTVWTRVTISKSVWLNLTELSERLTKVWIPDHAACYSRRKTDMSDSRTNW